MNTKTTTFFWLTTISILLLSLILSSHSVGVELLTKVGLKLGLHHIFYALQGLVIYRRHHSHHHHHRHPSRDESSCKDSLIWSSDLTSLYKISSVITVDKKGCANFSSVQKAIDAAPDFSRAWTLIVIDSGTYRYSSTSTQKRRKIKKSFTLILFYEYMLRV